MLTILTMLTGSRVPGKLVLEQRSITLGLWTPPRNHAEVCFQATLHHFGLILVITATCQSLFWNNTPSLLSYFGVLAWAQEPGMGGRGMYINKNSRSTAPDE